MARPGSGSPYTYRCVHPAVQGLVPLQVHRERGDLPGAQGMLIEGALVQLTRRWWWDTFAAFELFWDLFKQLKLAMLKVGSL